MAAVPDVTITAGVPTGGTGTVSTLDKFDGAAGAPATRAVTVQGIASGTPQPITGTITAVTAISNALPAGTNLLGKVDVQFAGTVPDTGSGTGGSKTQRVIIDSSQFSTVGQTTMSGSAPVAIASDQSAIPTIAKPSATTNGSTSSRVNAAASTNATSLKASSGNATEIDVFNNAAYAVFLKLYNKASAPTVGTDTPVWTIPIPAGAGYSKSFPRGKSFATGIAYAITKLQADSDTTAVVAGDLTGSIDWI